MSRLTTWQVATYISICLCLGGCGNAGDRAELSGSVTLDGAAIPKGSIAFRPVDSGGPSAGSEIVDGQFFVPADKGVRPGLFRVEITAMRKTGKSFKDPVFGQTDVEVQYVPAKYNVNSELNIDVPAASEEGLKFELTSE